MIKIIAIIIVIGGISGFYFFGNDDKSADKKNKLEQESNAVEQKANLSFEGSGRISSVNVSVGDTVSRGQILARLENEHKIRELANAKANLKLQEEILKELKSGFTSEKLREIEKQKDKVESTKNSLTDAQKDLISMLNEAFKSADETIRNNIDQFIKNPKGANPEIIFQMSDSNLKTKIELARFAIEVILDDWSDIASDLTIENGLLLASENTKDKLEQVVIFLDSVSVAVNSLTESDNLSQATIDGYILDVLTAQIDVNTALSDISLAEEDVKKIEILLTLEQDEFEQKTAGTDYKQILVQETIVENSEIIVENIQTEIDKTYLISPIDGVVAEQGAEIGETVSTGEVLVVIIPQEETIEEPQIEQNIPPVTNTTVTNPTYFGSQDPNDPITVELPSGKTIELWPGWR